MKHLSDTKARQNGNSHATEYPLSEGCTILAREQVEKWERNRTRAHSRFIS